MKTRYTHSQPAYPRTPHLPHTAVNMTADDLLASHEEVARIFLDDDIFITEKIDGTNLGMCLVDGYPSIRNKRNFLHKGHLGKTHAKNQYRPVFNWFHDHKEMFEELSDQFVNIPVVYGEWMYMRHAIAYDNLPSLFIAFAIWDGAEFVESVKSRQLLTDVGFTVPPLLHHGGVANYAQLVSLSEGDSEWVTEGDRRREGIYINHGSDRFKMVRADFNQGEHFSPNDQTIIKNKLRKSV